MRVRRHVNQRRGGGRRDEYTGETKITALRGEHTGRREANPIDEPGSCQERTGSILIGPSGAGAYATERYRAVPTMLPSKKTIIFLIESIAQCSALWFCALKLGSAYRAFCDNVGTRFSLAKVYTRTSQQTQ